MSPLEAAHKLESRTGSPKLPSQAVGLRPLACKRFSRCLPGCLYLELQSLKDTTTCNRVSGTYIILGLDYKRIWYVAQITWFLLVLKESPQQPWSSCPLPWDKGYGLRYFEAQAGARHRPSKKDQLTLNYGLSGACLFILGGGLLGAER